MNNILVLDNSAYIRHRIKGILKKYSIGIHEAVNSNEFFAVLGKNKNEIGLIITEVNLEKEDGLDIMAHAKKRGHEIPFLVLTGQNKKGIFIKSIENGAADYILKPFDDDFLLDRILTNMKFSYESDDSFDKKKVSMDFNRYISGEIKKAEKGRYELSAFMCVISNKDGDDEEDVGNRLDEVGRIVYPKIKQLFWDTDIFMSFGSCSYLGVLPFCTFENTKVVEGKIQEVFEELAEENRVLDRYEVETVFVTYPNEIQSKAELFPKLKEKLALMDAEKEHKEVGLDG
ncbi:Response regulator receiver domain-containing protein [Peptoclostridium litorale DSM 5388]|uniref:Stage 0 sporulation protein A homolog n=1 Tax=Peptoclostridium litorale DSM 5388 TaxID=1121324 RepID=A0A069RCD8_PEPLI|nr:response regulator [Peptoclostridium litorale]KDR94709.1 transcriptional regulator [Peptoclostridium litorale DSM 5388]SIO32929.1 Response regulator receiver domain-containing protein [Peptoclostridium litorale DSM 5388]